MESFRHNVMLNEDARSTIVGSLGLTDAMADAAIDVAKMYKLDEKYAFHLAKIYFLYLASEQFEEDEDGIIIGRISDERQAQKMARAQIRRTDERHLRRNLHVFFGWDQYSWEHGEATRFYLQNMPKKFTKLIRMAKSYADVKNAFPTMEADYVKRDAIMKFPDGYFWMEVADCENEAVRMQHCGQGRATLVSLRSADNAPHVTMDWDKDRGVIYQAKGKQNKLPVKKYWPYIFKFVDQFEVSKFLERGQEAGNGPPVDDSLRDAVIANTNITAGPFQNLEEVERLPQISAIKRYLQSHGADESSMALHVGDEDKNVLYLTYPIRVERLESADRRDKIWHVMVRNNVVPDLRKILAPLNQRSDTHIIVTNMGLDYAYEDVLMYAIYMVGSKREKADIRADLEAAFDDDDIPW